MLAPQLKAADQPKKIQTYLNDLPPNALAKKHVAAFDTRFAIDERGLGLKLLMKAIGFAVARIAGSLKSRGGNLVITPEGFIVEGKEGPLKSGELERAAAWMNSIRGYIHETNPSITGSKG